MRRKSPFNRGSALVLALVFLAIVGLATAAWLAPTHSRMRASSLFRRQSVLEEESQTGVDLVKQDLFRRAQPSSMQGLDMIDAGGLDVATAHGLVWSQHGPEEPHLVVTGEHFSTEVWVIPSSRNVDDPQAVEVDPEPNRLPKYFEVISKATNLETQESHTVEELVAIRFRNFSEFAFAMLEPEKKPDITKFVFIPSVYDGPVHFGVGLKPHFRWGSSTLFHHFMSSVTFAESGEKPFTYDAVRVEFDKGYATDVSLVRATDGGALDLDGIFDSMKGRATAGLPWESDVPLCLKMMNHDVCRYDCAGSSSVSVFDMYQNETAGSDDCYTLPASGATIYSSENISVKGVLDGLLTVVSEKEIHLAGDVVYRDSLDSDLPPTSRFGAVAKGNIVVPYQVPTGAKNGATPFYFADSATDPDNARLDGTVNFTNKWEDRASLEIDGALFSVKNSFGVQGLNDYDGLNPTTGLVIPVKDDPAHPDAPKEYAMRIGSPSDTEAFWIDTDGDGYPDARRGEPLFCSTLANNVSGTKLDSSTCLVGDEVPHMNTALNLRGSLVTKDFGKTQVRLKTKTGYFSPGFAKKKLTFDKELLERTPPNFPSSAEVLIHTISHKSYPGESVRLNTIAQR